MGNGPTFWMPSASSVCSTTTEITATERTKSRFGKSRIADAYLSFDFGKLRRQSLHRIALHPPARVAGAQTYSTVRTASGDRVQRSFKRINGVSNQR